MNFSGNGKLLHYVNAGHGPPVVLIHGLGSSRYDWEAIKPKLVDVGFHVFAVDLPGHGDSVKPEQPEFYTLQNIYRSLEDWLAELDISPPFYLVSHSLGGFLSLKYARQYPQNVRAMMLIDPLYTLDQINPLLRLANRRPNLGMKVLNNVPNGLIDWVLGWDPINPERFSLQTRLQIIIDIKRASPHILNIPRSLYDLTPDLGNIQTPTLVIWGDKDLTLKPSSFPELVSRLPNARGYAIRGSGHQPHVGRPGAVNQMVLEYITHHRNNTVIARSS